MAIENRIENRALFRRLFGRRSALLSITVSAVVIATLGCTKLMPSKEILEFDNVAQYSLSLDPKTKVPDNVSGLCFKSSYCVSGFTTSRQGATLLVMVEIGPCKEGQSGRFSIPIDISTDINELKFGTEKRLLWSRSNGTNGP